MKKILLIIASALLLLTGCQDAHATINNPNEEIVKVGETSITKGEIYNNLLVNFGSYYAVSDVTKKVVEAEIETTDEINKEVQEQIDSNKSMYGENWQSFLEAYGYKTEEEFKDSLILGLKLNELTKKYVNENWEELITLYNPKKAIILSFSDVDNANAALVELKNNMDSQEVATAYNSNSTGAPEIITSQSAYSSDVMSVINTASTSDDYAVIPSSDNMTTYIIKVLETDPNKIKDEVATELSGCESIANDSDAYYFEKYNFTIYDKTLYDSMISNYSNYVVQK